MLPKTPSQTLASRCPARKCALSVSTATARTHARAAPRPPQIITVDFDDPGATITTNAAWYNLSITAPLENCPQLPHNSSVWVSIVPKNPITLPKSNVLYDGLIWLGAQNFLRPVAYPFYNWGTGAGRCV